MRRRAPFLMLASLLLLPAPAAAQDASPTPFPLTLCVDVTTTFIPTTPYELVRGLTDGSITLVAVQPGLTCDGSMTPVDPAVATGPSDAEAWQTLMDHVGEQPNVGPVKRFATNPNADTAYAAMAAADRELEFLDGVGSRPCYADWFAAYRDGWRLMKKALNLFVHLNPSAIGTIKRASASLSRASDLQYDVTCD